ncbi:hypothetical protein GCM10020367_60440 [Streptomyces sannanensis]|uniref:Uncharacterized protein n=1 Tax=Streptomyces sannanensis TaxID=285536 RepID=A0ABP6SKL0_9ACTN
MAAQHEVACSQFMGGGAGTRVQPYLAYLHQRWNEGCTDAARLCAEIREQGPASTSSVSRSCMPTEDRYVAPQRVDQNPPCDQAEEQ